GVALVLTDSQPWESAGALELCGRLERARPGGTGRLVRERANQVLDSTLTSGELIGDGHVRQRLAAVVGDRELDLLISVGRQRLAGVSLGVLVGPFVEVAGVTIVRQCTGLVIGRTGVVTF